MTWAVVPAAGSGSRFESELPKQYLQIAGRSVLEHCLWRLAAHPQVNGIVVALSRGDQRFAQITLPPGAQVLAVNGGATRADSVLAALDALPDTVRADQAVLVHDAARPCVSIAMLDRLLACAQDPNGALLAVPCHDTLKRCDDDAAAPRSLATADRSQFWLAQTPQLFHRQPLTDALRAARDAGVMVTDEAMAMERGGARPRLVLGAGSNLKLTVAEDLPAIQAWLQQYPLS